MVFVIFPMVFMSGTLVLETKTMVSESKKISR
jgi:hypothetical protein